MMNKDENTVETYSLNYLVQAQVNLVEAINSATDGDVKSNLILAEELVSKTILELQLAEEEAGYKWARDAIVGSF